MNDDVFAATEAAYDRMLSSSKKEAEKDNGKDKNDPAKSKADSKEKKMKTDAGITPLVVDDKKSTLEDKLNNGFMAAYEERTSQAA
jgi:adenine-specific DNA-methyltransferase